MTAPSADLRRALKQYSEVTCTERQALWSWYRKAGFAEFVAALNDPSLEPSLVRLQRDYSKTSWPTGLALSVILAAIVFTLFAVFVQPQV